MSNQAFDRLAKKQNLQSANEAVAAWGCALVRTDVESHEIEFLARSFRSAKEWVKFAKEDLNNWWG